MTSSVTPDGVKIFHLTEETENMPEAKSDRSFKLLIEEYKSLRDEIGRFQTQQKQLIIAGIAGVGAIATSLLKGVADGGNQPYADFLLIGPIFFGTISFLFLEAEDGILRAGYYTGVDLKRRAAPLCDDAHGILEWESFRVIHDEKLSNTDLPKCTNPTFSSFVLPKLMLFEMPSVLCVIAFSSAMINGQIKPNWLLDIPLIILGFVVYLIHVRNLYQVINDAKTLNAHAVKIPLQPTPTVISEHTTSPAVQAPVQLNSSNGDVVDWQRTRAAMEHENLLINHRLTWWLSCQGGLLAVSALIFPHILSHVDTPSDSSFVISSSSPSIPLISVTKLPSLSKVTTEPIFQIMLLMLMLMGILTSLFFWRAVRAANRAHEGLERWWHLKFEGRKTEEAIHPPICGNTPLFPLGKFVLHYHHLPLTFAFVWFIIGVVGAFPTGIVLPPRVIAWGLLGTAALILLGLSLFLMWKYRQNKKLSQTNRLREVDRNSTPPAAVVLAEAAEDSRDVNESHK